MNNFKYLKWGLVALSTISIWTGCSNDEQQPLDEVAGATAELNINVSNTPISKVGGIISENQFPDNSSLGLFVVKTADGAPYDRPYTNVKYTSSISGSNQVWTTSPNPIMLTDTRATLYAYYPYSDDVKNIESIPIQVTDNKDVMWASPFSNLYNASPTATLKMNHALSVIQFSLTKDDYSGAGNIQSITVQGNCIAPSATLNAKTGNLTVTTAGNAINFGSLGSAATLSTTAKTVQQLVVPTSTSGTIKVTVQLDGRVFEVISPAYTTASSKIYKFGLTFSDTKVTMSAVSVDPIAEVDKGDIGSGCRFTWANALESDGVYAITSAGNPVPYVEANESSYAGVGFVVNGKAYQISNFGLSDIYWWKTGLGNISSLTDYTKADNTNSYGYLNGRGTPALSQDYTTWYFTTGAFSDFNGKDNTQKIIDAIGGTTANTIAKAVVDFRAGATNQGYTDWHVPSCGELVYMYLKQTEINTLLGKCGGTSLPTSYHWSSSEYSASFAWHVGFDLGSVNSDYKYYYKYVRFCREL